MGIWLVYLQFTNYLCSLTQSIRSCVQRPIDILRQHNDPQNVRLMEHRPPIKQVEVTKKETIKLTSFKETDQDVIRLQKMIKEEGLERVEEVWLPQDRTSLYTGYLDGDGKRKGHGIKIFKNGDKYEGEWARDKANGKGKFWHSDGDYYEGFWLDDKAHGQGLYTSANGSSYIGEW